MKEKKLFVGNLSYSTSKEELSELFSQHGTVESVNIIANKGFGFVEMSSLAEAESAKEALNLTHFGGRNLSVNEARPLRNKPRTGGFGGGFKRY